MRNKKLKKALILVGVFFFSVILFAILTHNNQENHTSEMEEATLPVIYLQNRNIYINQLFGNVGEKDALSMRDSITPLSKGMILPVTIHAFQNHVESIYYEVRTLDMERLVEQTQVSDYSQADGVIKTEFQIQNLLEEEVEYQLIITLECKGEEIRYYTRLIRSEQSHIEDMISLAMEFHAKTFDETKVADLATYLEPSSEGDNTTLQTVNLHSNLNQIGWADFKGEVLKEPVPSIKEVGNNFNTIVLNYVMVSTGAGGESEFYNVEEYYRIRYSEWNRRMYILDFERTMNEIFRGSGNNVNENGLLLGIRDADVSYMTNGTANIIAFVQAGDLWSYNSNTNQLSLVYSFRGREGLNDRTNHGCHDIKIIKVMESGNMDFAVYGYMNRGEHEGHTGVGVYHYDSTANTIQEQLFVEAPVSYEVLKENWGRLFYVSDAGNFYMIAEETLYRVDLETGTAEKMRSGLTHRNMAVAENGRYIAWYDDGKVTVMDLEGEHSKEIQGGEQEVLVPIGFVEADFVYGIANGTQQTDDQLLMHKVVIVDKDQQILKEYEKPSYYITNAYVENSSVILERVKASGNVFVATDDDTIKSHEIEVAQKIHVNTKYTDSKQTQILLSAEEAFSKKTPKVLTPKEVVVEEKKVIAFEEEPSENHYYVYQKGNLILCTEQITEAIRYADENAGIVLGDGLKYFWRRGKQNNVSYASKAILPDATAARFGNNTRCAVAAMLQAEGVTFDVAALNADEREPEQILRAALPDAKVLNLTGCSMSQVLYFVDQGSLVFARGEDQEPLVIVGYDEYNVILYRPSTNTTKKYAMDESEELFEDAGNIFITYLR